MPTFKAGLSFWSLVLKKAPPQGMHILSDRF